MRIGGVESRLALPAPPRPVPCFGAGAALTGRLIYAAECATAVAIIVRIVVL